MFSIVVFQKFRNGTLILKNIYGVITLNNMLKVKMNFVNNNNDHPKSQSLKKSG